MNRAKLPDDLFAGFYIAAFMLFALGMYRGAVLSGFIGSCILVWRKS